MFGIVNRVRGGSVYDSNNRVHGTLLAMMIIFLYTFSPIISIAVGLGYFIGSTWGWGVAVGSTAGTEKKDLIEWPLLDKLTSFVIKPPVKKEDGTGYDNIKRLRAWGTLWLTFRGIVWGMFVSLGFFVGMLIQTMVIGVKTSLISLTFSNVVAVSAIIFASLWPIILTCVALFACMGICFLLVSLVLGNSDMWEISEIFYGYFQGAAIALMLLL